MCKFPFSAAIAVLLCLPFGNAAAAKRELPGDIVMVLVPLAGYGIAHYKDDSEGTRQLTRSVTGGIVAHAIAAVAFNGTSWGERPNGRAYGFPSGHVALVMSGAQFLQDRYGWNYAWPAYLGVGYVAWLRVDTGHHYWRDAVGGAALAYGVSKLFVTPQNATHIAPVIGPKFIGLRWKRSY